MDFNPEPSADLFNPYQQEEQPLKTGIIQNIKGGKKKKKTKLSVYTRC
jgi:hypothetical protein